MLKKTYSKTGRACRVTFKVEADQAAEAAAVLGEFNSWDPEAHPMKKRKDGSLSATVSLEPGQEYRYRYLLDGDRWVNDNAPESEVGNRFGTLDCVIAV